MPKSALNPMRYISKYGKFIQIFEYDLKHAQSKIPCFPLPCGFPTGHAFKCLHQTDATKYENAMPKS